MTSLKIVTMVERICNTKLDDEIREIYNFREIMLANLKKSLENSPNGSISAFENVLHIVMRTQSKISPTLMNINDQVVADIRSQIRSYENADRRTN